MKIRRLFGCCAVAILAAGLLYAIAVLAHGVGDFRLCLPGGYQLASHHNEGNAIVDRDSYVVIGENVDSFQVVKHLVVGHVTPERPPHTIPEACGYFVLDTGSGSVHKAMKKSDWASALRIRGIHRLPKLSRPNLFLAWLSRVGIR